MSNIELCHGSSRGLSRHVGRTLVRIDGNNSIRRAEVVAEADLMSDKIEAIGQVTGRALQTIALVSQMEQKLALSVPSASGRLAAIADASAITMTGLVAGAACTLKRI